MSSCRSCLFIDLSLNKCSVGHKKPLRNCLTPILNNYHKLLSAGDRILEVGCGAWSPTLALCQKIGAQWEGIDILTTYLGKKTIATKIASVESIPFDSNYFDFVIANQSMEHWEENRVSIVQGLNEIFRVLKPGGMALINVPIHFHGSILFLKGDIEQIRKLFDPYSDAVTLEKWRIPSDPLPPVLALRKRFWFSPLRASNSYILDIQVKKKKAVIDFPLPPRLTNLSKIRSGLREFGLLYYPTSFVLHLFSKLGM